MTALGKRSDAFARVDSWAWHGRVSRDVYLEVCRRLGRAPLPDPATVEMRPQARLRADWSSAHQLT